MKPIIGLVFLLFLVSCSDEQFITDKYTIQITEIYNQNGIDKLIKDTNGFFHLKLININNVQQIHRVTGKLLKNGLPPYPQESVQFESNLYWVLKRGSLIATIVETYPNYYTGEFITLSLPPFISQIDELVPTTNRSSYSTSNDGIINDIIAPILELKGDTMILKTTHYKSNTIIYTKIILE